MRSVAKGCSLALAAGLAGALATLAPRGAAAAGSPLDPSIIYNYGENETTRSLGMGGALRALGNGTSAIYLNPAAMVETRVYHLEAFAQITPETGRQVYGGTVVDSVTGRLAGSISVVGALMDPDGLDRSAIDVRLGLAYPISERFFIGLGGRYAKITQSGIGPLGDSKVSGGLKDPEGGRYAIVNTVTFDAGLIVKPTDSVYLAAVGQNLTYPNNGLLPTTVGGGIGYGNENLSLEADGLADLNSWGKPKARLMVGGEYLLINHIPLRLGYRFDQGANLHTLSTGLGYIGNEFSIEASVKRILADQTRGSTTMVFSVAYFFESSGLTRTPTADLQ